MPPESWAIGVVIPARNEEQTIERCVYSVLIAHDALRQCGRLWIVIVADSCTDRTVESARMAVGGFGEVIECNVHSAGSARRLGVATVLNHFGGISPSHIWLANTDADSHVPANWLHTHLEFAKSGETALAGIVELEPNPNDEAQGQAHELFRKTYRLAEDGSHSHVHGANLGVRADAYLDVGGWSHAALAEDHCLWGRLKLAGWKLRSSVRSVVTTSARLRGRACGGFADTLHAHVAAHGG